MCYNLTSGDEGIVANEDDFVFSRKVLLKTKPPDVGTGKSEVRNQEPIFVVLVVSCYNEIMNTIAVHDVYGNSYQTNTENLRTSVHVYGIAEQDGKILISPQFDGFDFPGGTAEKGETHLETLKREFKEETGFDVEPTSLLGVYTSFFRHVKTAEDFQSYLIYYRVKLIGGKLSDAGFDEAEKLYASLARWATVAELKQMRHACSVDILDDLLKNLG